MGGSDSSATAKPQSKVINLVSIIFWLYKTKKGSSKLNFQLSYKTIFISMRTRAQINISEGPQRSHQFTLFPDVKTVPACSDIVTAGTLQ